MCIYYIISYIQYICGFKYNQKNSNEKLENNREKYNTPKFSPTLRRKSSHQLNVDYDNISTKLSHVDTFGTYVNQSDIVLKNEYSGHLLDKIPENEELIENKINILISKKAISKQKMTFIEKNIKIYCDCCKRELLHKQIIYRMMDKYFCSEYCRYRTFPQHPSNNIIP
jgi:hypothetical protein